MGAGVPMSLYLRHWFTDTYSAFLCCSGTYTKSIEFESDIPKMRDQQQTVQAVHDLQHEDVSNKVTPQRHDHDAGRKRGLKQNAAQWTFRRSYQLHGCNKANVKMYKRNEIYRQTIPRTPTPNIREVCIICCKQIV